MRRDRCPGMRDMKCTECRRLAATTRKHERTAAEAEKLAAHTLKCVDCAEYVREMEAIQGLLRSVGQEAAPDDFASMVMKRVERESVPAHSGWFERLFGTLRAPSPVIPLRQAVSVAALVLMLASAGMLVMYERENSGTPAHGTVTVAEGGSAIQGDAEFVQELVRRHQTSDTIQPVPEDEGMRLVSY